MFDHLASAMQGPTFSDDVDDADDDERLDCPKAWPLRNATNMKLAKTRIDKIPLMIEDTNLIAMVFREVEKFL